MSDSTTKQTERVEALYQLSLSIGNSLDLQQMLSESGAAFFEQMAAFSLGIYQRVAMENASTELGRNGRFQLQEQYTKGRIKRNSAYRIALAHADLLLEQGADTLAFVNQHENSHQYGFDLPDYGVMIVLKKGDPLSAEEIEEKRPLFRKLAIAAAACNGKPQQPLSTDMQLTRLAAAVEQSLDGTAVADLEGNIQFSNPAWANMHGYQVDELIGQPLAMFHTEEQLQNEVTPFNQKIMETGGNQGEITHKRKDGSTFPTWMTVALLKNDDGVPIGLVASAQDITGRKRSQIQAQSILDSITVPLVVSRIADGTVIYINQLLADVIRLPLTDLIGQQTPDFYYDSVDRVAMLTLLQERGSLSKYEIRLKRNDGEMFWGLISIRPFDYQGESVLLSTILDITDRKLMQEGLQDREEELASLLKYSREAIGLINTETGLFESPNKAAEELYGLEYEQLVAVGPAHMSPEFQPDGRPSGEAAMEKIGEAMAGGRPIFEWMHINALSEEIPCEISLVGMSDELSHLVRFSAINITERKQAQVALQASETRYHTLFDAAADAIELVNGQGILVDCNDVYLQALGYERDEAIGQHVTNFFTAEGAGLFKKMYPKLRKEGYVEAEADLVRKDGSIIRVWRKARATYDDNGEMNGIVVYNRDITERQRIEAAIEAHAVNLEAVADVSTIISAILEVDELLQVVSDTIKEHFGFYHAHIYLMSEDGNKMVLTAGAGEAGKKLVAEQHHISLDHPHSLVAKAVQAKTGIIVNDVSEWPEYMTNPHLPDTQAEMAIPIILGDRVLGVLDVQSDEIDYFSREDRNIQTTLASQVAVALQNADQYHETQEILSETEALLAITRTASGTLDLEIVLDDVLGQVLAVTGFESGLFSVVNVEMNTLELHAHRLPEEWVTGIRAGGLDGTLCDLVYRGKKPITLTDLAEDAPIDVTGMLEAGYKAYQGVPLEVQGKVLGTLCLFSKTVLTARDADMGWLIAVGHQIGFAIQNVQLFEQSEAAVAELDVLTRRLTREGWDDYVDTQEQTLSFVYDNSSDDETVVEQQPDGTAYDHPLLVYGEKIGNLALFSHDDADDWDDETAEIITAVAAQLTARIENLRLTDETQRALSSTEAQAKQLATINHVAQVVSQQSNLEKMLEIVYKELQTVMPTDSFFAGLYNAEASTLTIPINFEGEHYRNEALTVQLTPESQSYTVIQSGQPLLRNLTSEEIALQSRSGPGIIGDTSQERTASQLFVPLQAGAKRLGVLSVQSYERDAYKESDTILLEGVANYVAVALENLRLFSETEERAEQLATINRVAHAISEQLDLEQMLESVYEQLTIILPSDSFFISLYDKKTDMVEYPLVFEGDHRSSMSVRPVGIASSTRKVIDSGKPILRHMTQEEADAVYEESVRTGTALGDHSQEVTKSSMFVPMQSGQNMVGILSIQSYQFDVYTESDVELVMGIAQYLTIAIENIRLFTDTQMRASQLEKLSEIEGALSQAKSESEVIQALALFSDEDQAITLHYVEESEDDTPSYAYTVAHWENGECHPDDEYLMKPFLIEQHAGTNIGLLHPDRVTFIPDIEQDARMDADAIEEAQRIGYGAVVIVPMRSAGRWQGFVSLKWPQAHQFTSDELFLWRQLREPVGAVVAGRRAFMAQQGTLQETEALYEAGEKFNKASTYRDVLDVMREYTLVGSGAQNVSLNYFSKPWVGDEMPEEVYVLARRTAVSTEGKFQHTTPRYRLSDFPSVRQVLQRDFPALIEDAATDTRFGSDIRALYIDVYGAVSTVFVPLVAGGQWFGYINAIYQQATEFPEADVRRLMVLAGQAAVSIQSIHLLEETTKRAQREQTLRQVTERVRGAASVETVLQTAVQELSRALGRRAFIQLTPDMIGEAEHEQ